MNSKPVVVILRGPPGAGKTTTALLLRERLAPAARLSIDTFRYLVTPRPMDQRYLRIAKIAAARTAVDYAAAGICSVLDSVFLDIGILQEVCEILKRGGVEYYVFSLRAPLGVIEDRDAQRGEFYRQGASRVRELYDSFEWIGEVIETQERVIEEVVAEIQERLDLLRTRFASADEVPALESSTVDSDKYCVFLRHGTCHLDPLHYQLEEEVHLSPIGHAEMAATASALVGFHADRLVASPFRRAVESAAIVASFTQLTMESEDGLRERHLNSLAGQRYDDLEQRRGPDFLNKLLNHSESLDPEGEESVAEARCRIVETMHKVMSGPGRRIIALSHGGPHSWLLNSYLGLSLDRDQGFRISNAHFSVFRYNAQGEFRSVLALNLGNWDARILD